MIRLVKVGFFYILIALLGVSLALLFSRDLRFEAREQLSRFVEQEGGPDDNPSEEQGTTGYFVGDSFQSDYDFSLGKFNFEPARHYTEDVLKETYRSSEPLTLSEAGVFTFPNTVQYWSAKWRKDPWDIYVATLYRLEGAEGDDTLLDMVVTVESTRDAPLGDEQQAALLEEFFFTPQDIDFLGNARTILDPTQDASTIREVVGENEDGSLESRGVWTIGNPDGSVKISFSACRIMKDSPLYATRSCYHFGNVQ